MLGSYSVTLEVLADYPASEAMPLLIAGLESSRESISLAAALALLDRHGMQGPSEVLRRLPHAPPAFLQAMQARAEKFDPLLRQTFAQGTAEQRSDALQGVLALQAVEQIPQIINLLSREDAAELEAAAECLRGLVIALDEESRGSGQVDYSRNSVTSRRDRALMHLEQALDKFEAIQEKDAVVESILALAPPAHPIVKKALWQACQDCRDRAGRLLLTSMHPKVMRQVMDSLKQSYPHPKAFEAVQTRTDVEFLCELLRTVEAKPGAMFEQNLKQIEHLAWLEAEEIPFGLVPPALQPALLTLVFSTKIQMPRKLMVQDWLLHHGGSAGRIAAAERAAGSDEHVMQHVLMDSLDADDEQVQAWAVTHLRQHAVPEAFALLVQRLDSPLPGVRAAVREELSDFNLQRVLGLLDALDASTALRVGAILRKIDNHALEGLERELMQGIRPKRIHAVQAVFKLGFHRDLLPQLLKLAEDEDFMLRRTLAEILEHVLDSDVLPVLNRLTQDSHPRVRDAAVNSLARWKRRSPQELDPLLVQ